IIIKNSILYGKTSGNIWISSKEEQNKIQIIFSDDGAGVPEESIRKIYDKFYRVDNSITYKVSGVGVGLFIAKRIVQLHKGEIHSNNNLEKGLITYINLPKQVN
ncbi:MAG: ATP-binding protein, partial [Leptospiraceae bacterium]|nr:ATP-binding protein [Leptospiraceae bacterium]